MGTKQCAAICLSHSCLTDLGDCQEAGLVWTEKAIEREYRRRPCGPLFTFFEPKVSSMLRDHVRRNV